MPWTFAVDPARRVCTLTLEGVVSGSDVAAAMRAHASDTDWRPGFCELWDGLAVTQTSFDRDELRDVAALEEVQGERHEGGRVAIVTVSLQARAVLVALLTLYGKGHRPHRVFATRDEAEAWLENRG